MTVKLLTEQHLEYQSLESESTLVKIPHCWKSHVTAQLYYSTYRFRYWNTFWSWLCYVERSCFCKYYISTLNRGSCFIEFIKQVGDRDKM